MFHILVIFIIGHLQMDTIAERFLNNAYIGEHEVGILEVRHGSLEFKNSDLNFH